jgi:hypothetical protein
MRRLPIPLKFEELVVLEPKGFFPPKTPHFEKDGIGA